VENTQFSQVRMNQFTSSSSNEFIIGYTYLLAQVMSKFLSDLGISQGKTVRYTPQMNGKAERMNETLLNKGRTLLIHAGLGNYFFGKAVLCAAYLLNRTLTLKNTTVAATKWYGKGIDYFKLYIFGCDAYLKTPKKLIARKSQDRSTRMLFVGYTRCAYKLYDFATKKIVEGVDVIFKEEKVFSNVENARTKANLPIIDAIENVIINDENNIDVENIENIIIPETNDNFSSNNFFCIYNVQSLMNQVPKSYNEAVKSENWPLWQKAIDKELLSIKNNDTWRLVERPLNKQILSSRWVFKHKIDSNGNKLCKARLVVRGCKQNDDIRLVIYLYLLQN
jgi:hypothetical protein